MSTSLHKTPPKCYMIRAYDSLPNPITNSGAPRLNPRTSYYSSEPARYQRRITFKQKGENSTSYRKHNNGKCKHNKHTFYYSSHFSIKQFTYHIPIITPKQITSIQDNHITHNVTRNATNVT